ncbi:coiled-coil domain-containing protein 14 isoform X2 [Nematostella vectensis]|uniref:coiled-coil domain-containing protein 14 isoform X2 n=1 Tax=Nematostella vectensis TaxID=45351 RepID=UPI002076E4C8|nr:coiled-coil domain-containing protein 14 isoform X2 [Nematostella vectensis]
MKKAVNSKPSKASLVSRGLATKNKSKKNNRTKKYPQDAKPGYSLYSTDSEDQASVVGHGLDRCAALLTNILDNDDKGKDQWSKKARHIKTAVKARQGVGRQSNARAVVIPTAQINQQDSPSPGQDPSHQSLPPRSAHATIYNDRLVASTPLLTADERERQQALLKREKELTQQLEQLKQHYHLLQNQRSPEVQEDQKRLLQNSMLHELEDFQQTMPESPKVNVSVHRDAHTSSGSTKARRSLDFPSSLGSLLETSRTRKPTSHGRHSIPKTSTDDHSYGRSATKNLSPEHEVPYELSNAQDTNKKVRIVSPTLPHSDKSSSHTPRDWSESRVQAESPVQKHGLQSSLPGSVKPRSQSLIKGATRPRYGGSSVDHTPERSPVRSAGSAGRSLLRGAGGDAQTLLYLVSELREVIGNSDDIEVQRLLMEIENTSSLLPYLYASSASPRHPSSANDEVQSLRIDNAQLRRNLRMANEKLQEQREIQQSLEELKSGHTNVSFEPACKSENANLQRELQEEKARSEKLRSIIRSMEKATKDLKEDKSKFMYILQNKELEFTKGRRNAQLEASRLSVEVRQLKSELEASKLSSEAAEKENVILTLSLKQKDKEIERLGEMTRGLQQSMRRVLLDIDEYHPGSVVKDHLLKQPRVMEHMGITLGTETSQQYSLSPLANIPAVHDAAKATPRDEREFRTQSTARHQQSSLDGSLHRSTLENSIQEKSNSARKTTHRAPIPKISNTPKLAWSPGKDSTTILTRESALPLSSRGGWVRDNRRTPNSPRFTWTSPDKPLEGPGLLNTLAVLGMNSPSSRPGANDTSADLSSLSSQDEQEFQRDLASLDADIARIQRSLRQAALKTEHDDGKHSP